MSSQLSSIYNNRKQKNAIVEEKKNDVLTETETTQTQGETEDQTKDSEGSSAIYGIGLLFLLIGGMLAYIKMNSHQWK